jgi:hypothetical protein
LLAQGEAMAKLDSAKEKIGWLKVVFTVVAAGDASLIAWVYQSYEAGRTEPLPFAAIFVLELTAVLFWIHFYVYRTVDEMERL